MQRLNIRFFILFALSFLMMAAHAQPVKNYTAQWKKVTAFINKGLPQSALTEVKKIYAMAKKEGQDAQVVKSLVTMITIQSQYQEDNETSSIREIEKEIAGSRQPATAFLQIYLAGFYYSYYQQHRWDLYQRSETVNFKKDDVATWSTEDFHRKISELYQQAIGNEKLLQQTKLERFDAIIFKGNVRHLRPTLYDLLAHTALEYFENDERDIRKPAYAFEIAGAEVFAPAAQFANLKFETKDSLSLLQKALTIYQELVAFHLGDKKPDALLDVDIHRLQFVYEKSVHPAKDSLYLAALQAITAKYGDLPAASQAQYLVAAFYEAKANEYKSYGDSLHRLDRKKAMDICEQVLKQKDSSEGKINCYNLLQQIKRPVLQFYAEKVNVPDQPFRVLVEYRNIRRLYFRLVTPTEKQLNQEETQSTEEFWKTMQSAKPVRQWQQPLPGTEDLQTHKAEVPVEALTPGQYYLIASPNESFSGKDLIAGGQLITVSSISYVNDGTDYFILDRDRGTPLANANVQVWERTYDYKTSKYQKTKGSSFKADQHGFFKWAGKVNDYNHTYYLDISFNKDRLFTNNAVYDYYYFNANQNQPELVHSVFLFTDRSIYRPGQPLFYKGIVLQRNPREKNGSVSQQYETVVVLRDANGVEIDSVKVKTNEYGSFSGKFQLPEGSLNGAFSLFTRTGDGNASVRVEEYKRPKFYVDFDTIRSSYKVNDIIRITGIAKAYAGNNIDGANVRYRVVRQPRFLYPWMFWRWWQPPTREMEIVNGEITSDKDGKFIIEFKAIPDLQVDRKFQPVFDYTVYADVTDINGETRSGERSITAGYQSIVLRLNIPSSLSKDSLKTLSIRTENMNGDFVSAKANVTISKLKNEERLIRPRYWNRPDQFIMAKEEYLRYFPHDEYDNETDPKSWAKENKVYEKSDSTSGNGDWKLSIPNLTPGYYIIEVLVKNEKGEEVRDVSIIQLIDESKNRLDLPQYLWTEGARPIEPGEKTSVKIGSSADQLFVVQQTDRSVQPGKLEPTYQFLQLDNEKKQFDFTATEKDRGGYSVSWVFIKHNRIYQYSQLITVPWTNKELNIEFATFRDKTLPGSEEKWKVRLTGYRNEKVAAEMLASMYDASLDQFYFHQWSKPYFWPLITNYHAWNGNPNFGEQSAMVWDQANWNFKELLKNYDHLGMDLEGNGQRNRDLFSTARPELMEMKAGAPSREQDRLSMNQVMKKDGLPIEGSIPGVSVATKDEELSDTSAIPASKNNRETHLNDITQIRKNFNETAFFFPDLHTDSTGAIEFSFTMPEALTRWKFQAITHTKEGAFGYASREIVTQKDLMVQPNAPRFLREGDRLELSAKVVNMSDKEITGTASLELFDATTNTTVDGWFRNMQANQYFTIAAGQSESVKFPVEIPYQFNKALVWRIVAKGQSTGANSSSFSDGEEAAMPVLTNRMLVTETLPLVVRGSGSTTINFDKLLKSGSAETLQQYALTVEYSSNPAWYAVQSLPYLMEYPYECSEQTWNRYYANSIASMIVNASPRIKAVFDAWSKELSTGSAAAALLSNLQKNQELKSVLLEETPWVMEAKTEAEQKKNIAILFDLVRMTRELSSNFDKLKALQSSNGGFVWFKDGPDDRYITQYILTGIGHLKKIGAIAKGQEEKLDGIIKEAVPYLDKKIKEDYDYLIKHKANLKLQQINYIQIQYLYMRSFFPEIQVSKSAKAAYDYYFRQAGQFWTKQTRYMQGMLALTLGRKGSTASAASILRSLKETSISSEKEGMYWKEMKRGWYWYEAPIETQALLIEAFQEIGNDKKAVDDLKLWLLRNKQTNNWKTTKATAEACYALLLQGSDLLSDQKDVEINLGPTSFQVKAGDTNDAQAGTGYFKRTVSGEKIVPEMGAVSINVSGGPSSSSSISWGAVYWQYFEDLDKITTSSTPLNLVKKLFVERRSDRGPVIVPVNDGDALKVGDKIKVRIELRVDRDMEYVHMKDMRASCSEPVNVLSSYKWQGGLGYYKTTKDASTNFFFNDLRKGTYVFEYSLFISHAGNFSNGITSIQSMYAPEFAAHSEGIRINVE